MSNRTPKTQNQWAGFQVRECNDYDESTGICNHEETPVMSKGGLFGHPFPNNICKYFHRGRDGTSPRTFKRNIAAGLINMEYVAEEILRQADKNILEGKPYRGAAVREVHAIMQSQKEDLLSNSHQSTAKIGATLSSEIGDQRQPAPRRNYSKLLWQRMKEKEWIRTGIPNSAITRETLQGNDPNNTSNELRFASQRRRHNFSERYNGYVYEVTPNQASTHLNKTQTAISVGEHPMDAAYAADMQYFERRRRKDDDRYDQMSGVSTQESGSYYHPIEVERYVKPTSMYNYNMSREISVPHAAHQNCSLKPSNVDGSNDDVYRQRYSSVPPDHICEHQGNTDSALTMVSKSGENAEECISMGSLGLAKLNTDEPCFQRVEFDIGEAADSSNTGFIAQVHFLKPPSSYHAAYHWAQLWLSECDEYNPQSDVCQHERKLWRCSFPEKACLHFHRGRNSEKRRTEVLTSMTRADREYAAQVLIADRIENASPVNCTNNPTSVYIQSHKITGETLIKNEIPSSFTVRTVDLPFHWSCMAESDEAVQLLPEIVFISNSPLFKEKLLRPIIHTFGYDIAYCEKRRTSANETQYFIWTHTRNGQYLKGLDSLFTLASGALTQLGIAVGDVTICPAERLVPPCERLRFLLVDEVADFRVQFSVPLCNALFRKLNQLLIPAKWKFRSLLDEHKGIFRHILTRSKAPETPAIIRMNNHSIGHLHSDSTEYILYDRQLNEKELNLTQKSLLLYTPAGHTVNDIAPMFKRMSDARVVQYDRQRSLNLSLLAFYMRILKYVAHKKRISLNEIQVILVGGRTVEKSFEVNGIYKIFGASISRPLHRVVTIRFKNEKTPDGYPRYSVGETTVPLSHVKEMLQSGHMGEVMEMICLTGPTLIDACVADLPTVSTLQDQTHLLDDPTRLLILMSSEESWMHDLTVVQGLRNGSLNNMLVLVKTRQPNEHFQTLFDNQNIILFDRSDTGHARHCLRLFILSGIARHLIHLIGHSNEKEEAVDRE
ncbi:hypothetical protein XU18_0022 [Perkinsela sp. CCAP 1560/4]|nr:hypothetical protein XU18_0022 [Perkinsela sp. CCAP 1560/4]|eukprot:KNH09337.1 hypothetical protein XU18_0022 [Perkinsela sp. CCAP 1560/4]